MLLYIHIPFCDSKCFYCAFNSYTDKFHLKQQYMRALEKQLENDLNKYVKDYKKIETVFIGGGTPSCVEANEYINMFNIIKPYLKDSCEITSEANPNSATKNWMSKMKELGVNRISFGVQSFNDKKLKYLNRAHNSDNAIKAIQNASRIGFNYINCDIIFGVTGDSFLKLKKDFDILNSLSIKHISLYSLTLEEGTKFYKKSRVKIDDEDLSYELYSYLNSLDFKQYEISNFAKSKEDYSKHNFGYWEGKSYLGIGAGAVGFIKDFRYYPTKNIENYIKNPLDYEIEKLSSNDIKVEKVLLGLRCLNGFEKNILNNKEYEKVKDLIENDKLSAENNRIFNKNFLLADEIALYILD